MRSTMVLKNLQHMIQTSLVQLVSVIFIISFLLLFANVLIVGAERMQSAGNQIKEKLGIYFYLDDSKDADGIYTKAIDMISELEQVGLQVDFYSKEDAFKLLEKRLPNVIWNLEKYGISNPLPPTLYVTFRNQEDYEVLKSLIIRYDDIIMNLDDLNAGRSFSQQENRVAKVINLTNFITYLAYFLIAVIILIIVAFLLYTMKINFFRFHPQLELEKLLGATYRQIKGPFLLYSLVTLVGAFVLTAIYLMVILGYLNTYFVDVFGADVYTILITKGALLRWLFLEFVLVTVLSVGFSYLNLGVLLRKV